MQVAKTMNILLLVLGLTAASAGLLKREKRQLPCQDPFKNVPNPCTSNPTDMVYFPHPTDRTKFLQCDMFKQMYIIQCPLGNVYNSITMLCSRLVQITLPPVIPTRHPLNGNPCTAQNIAVGNIYFAVKGDPFHFIECDLQGNAIRLACPNRYRWNQATVSCLYSPNIVNPTTPGMVLPTTKKPTTGIVNPCTSKALSSGKLFYVHPDPHKFIQCDPWGDFFINTCPQGLIWDNQQETCFSPFQSNNIF